MRNCRPRAGRAVHPAGDAPALSFRQTMTANAAATTALDSFPSDTDLAARVRAASA
jgi:hypothetical protein